MGRLERRQDVSNCKQTLKAKARNRIENLLPTAINLRLFNAADVSTAALIFGVGEYHYCRPKSRCRDIRSVAA